MSNPSSRQILERLVGFPTISRDSNLELITFIHDYLAKFNIDSELFHNTDKTKASLFATIGGKDKGGIILSGHTDVVPVDGQDWAMEPFQLSEHNNKLYGRGTADMKGFIASVLAAVPLFIQTNANIPIHLAFSYDEEVGCLGVRPMLAELAKRPLKYRLCIIGEPTDMKPILAHKGKLAMRCTITGYACHSAYAPYGVNAIEYAAKLINRLGEIGMRQAEPQRHNIHFDPPYTTVQTGVIKGGLALNIVPATCEFDFEIRSLPDFDAQIVVNELQQYAQVALIPSMQEVQADTDIQMHSLSGYPGLITLPDSDAAKLLALICGSNDFGAVAFGTEGGLFQQVGIPTVVCGPGSIEQAHKPDEFIHIDQLNSCDAMLIKLANTLSIM